SALPARSRPGPGPQTICRRIGRVCPPQAYSRKPPMNIRIFAASAVACLLPVALNAQMGVPARPLPDQPFVIDTAEQGQVQVTVMKGLELPWDLAFLPNGDMLVTERPARRLRVVRGGELDPQPITGLPEIGGGGGGL